MHRTLALLPLGLIGLGAAGCQAGADNTRLDDLGRRLNRLEAASRFADELRWRLQEPPTAVERFRLISIREPHDAWADLKAHVEQHAHLLREMGAEAYWARFRELKLEYDVSTSFYEDPAIFRDLVPTAGLAGSRAG